MVLSARPLFGLCLNLNFYTNMKKIAIVAACVALCGVVSAGQGDKIKTVNSTDLVSASVNSPFSWEVAAVYNHALTDIDECANTPSIDTYGVDLTGIYTIRDNHKATLRFGFAYGEACGYDVYNFTFMPGYRYELPVTEKVTAFAGAGFGLGLSMLDYPGSEGKTHGLTSKDDMINFVYNFEVGARYAINKTFDVVGALMFNGGLSTINDVDYANATEEQMNIGVRVGIGGKF